MSLLEIRNLEVTYAGHAGTRVRAVAGVDLDVEAGQIVALVGESGCGKSSLGKAAVGLVAPSAGTIRFAGEPLQPLRRAARPRSQRKLQMVFQDPFSSLNPVHTIRHHLERPLRLHQPNLGAAERKAAAAEVLARVQLDPALILPKYPHELSGGQRQRISIARALAVNPEVIVADEPTSMLDVSVRLGILNLLNDMKRQMRLAVLYITHDIATARYVAEEIMVMYAGQIVEWGETDRVLGNPQHPYTRLLLSAVPDPDRRFGDARPAELEQIETIRRQSALEQTEIREVAPGHFIRPMPV